VLLFEEEKIRNQMLSSLVMKKWNEERERLQTTNKIIHYRKFICIGNVTHVVVCSARVVFNTELTRRVVSWT
jgi:hypothetical protein